jgi:hypothetical protein
MRFLMAVAIACTLAGSVSGQAPQESNPPTREFPSQKCRYTLPGKEWKWMDQPLPDSIFMATSKAGLVITFRCDRVEDWKSLDRSTVADFEQAMNRSTEGRLKKRGGRFIIFLGLSCYQFEGVYADGRTIASRLILANGLAYHIMVAGDQNPVEQRPEFEKIISGFQFTDAPLVTTTSQSAAPSCLCFSIGMVGFLIVVLAIVRALRPRSRSKPQVRLRRQVDERFEDDFDEVLPVESPTMPGHTGVRTRQMPSPLPKPAKSETGAESFEDGHWARKTDGPKGVGNCRHCGHWPVAFGAEECHVCAGRNPNPGVISRFAGRGTWIGAAAGASLGSVWGYFVIAGGGSGVIAGLMLGVLAGILSGLITGLLAGAIARLSGMR